MIVEPLVQCAGGMRMYHPVYLKLLREACDRHGVHLIADEIAVGFGRTGTMFACEQAGISPDFMCLSKGLTGGYLPLSVVLTGESVYAAFYDEYAQLRAFLHSHSYTGNPLACAAALATLAIFETDGVIERNRALAAHLGERARAAGRAPHVAEVRQRGMIVAVELARDGDRDAPFAWQERRGLRVYRHALDARGAAAADRQRRLLHAAVRDHARPDRRTGRDGARGHRGRDMRLSRVFCDAPLAPGAEVALPAAAANHVARVLRLRAGAPLVAFDGSGRDYHCEVVAVEGRPGTRAGRRRACRRLRASHRSQSRWCRQFRAASAWTRRCRRQPSSASAPSCRCSPHAAWCGSTSARRRKLRHWQAVVVGACEQCGRSVLPRGPRPAGTRRVPGRLTAGRAATGARARRRQSRWRARGSRERGWNC